MVDVIVTIQGGADTGRAVDAGGGLVGLRSSENVPPGAEIQFVDWPFQAEDVTVDEHVDVVRRHRPRYAVAPDVQGDRALEDVLAVADELGRFADTVIVVPKTVSVDRVPRRFRVGVPFRDNFETDTGVNTFFDFRGRPVHILGGNATDQFGLADEVGLDVQSVDTPLPAAWADFGRVWIGRTRSADDAIEILEDRNVDVVALEGLDVASADVWLMDRSRRVRIAFSVHNLITAWNNSRRVVELPVRVEPGRGPPPPMDEPIETFDEELSIEEQRERFRQGTMEVEVGRADPEVPDTLRTTFSRFVETDRSSGESEGDMADDDEKRRYWQRLQERSDEEVDGLGLGPDSLPDRNIQDRLRALYPDVKLDILETDEKIELEIINVPPDRRGEGTGTEILEELTVHADRVGKRIELTPTGDLGGERDRLARFYRRFGFVENEGENRDFTVNREMYRRPNNERD